MRSTALAFATLLALTTTVAPLYAQEVEIEEAPADEDLGDLGARPRGPQAPEVQYGIRGPYGIAAGTYAAEDFKNPDDAVPAGFDFDNTFGLNLRAGYRWHPNLSTEAEFEWLDGFELEDDGDGVGEVWSLTVNQKGYLSYGRIQPFLLLGLGIYEAVDSEVLGQDTDPQGTGFGVRAGGGFSFYLNEHWGLNLDAVYNFATGDLDDLRYTSLSWGFIFHP